MSPLPSPRHNPHRDTGRRTTTKLKLQCSTAPCVLLSQTPHTAIGARLETNLIWCVRPCSPSLPPPPPPPVELRSGLFLASAACVRVRVCVEWVSQSAMGAFWSGSMAWVKKHKKGVGAFQILCFAGGAVPHCKRCRHFQMKHPSFLQCTRGTKRVKVREVSPLTCVFYQFITCQFQDRFRQIVLGKKVKKTTN